MDPGFPGSFERVFQQYDRIVSRSAAPERKSLGPETPVPTEAPVERPSLPPSLPPSMPPPPPDLPEKNVPPEELVGFSDAPPWEEPPVVAPAKSRGDRLAERMAEAERKINEKLKNPNGASFEQDESGLEKAYADPSGVYYDPASSTEYVRGTTTLRDWYDDFTKVPFYGDLRESDRYQKADESYNDLIHSGRPVDRVVGHSLGGSVALEMQKQHNIPKSRTFGAPVLDLFPKAGQDRYRHPLDPVSVLDRSANWGDLRLYSHSYTGFA